MESVRKFITYSVTRLDTVKTIARKMTTLVKTQDSWNYKECVSLLNSLQSNATAVKLIRERIRRREDCVNIAETWKYLNRTGITQEDLKKLSVIHVAGTKGKGTTSAMCESILRQYGYRTGLYTSPHLVSITERIQIEGRQLSNDSFSNYFSRVYRNLLEKQEYEGDMPGYFMFITVLAFDVFLNEKVDVAVVEVGIGGEHDITNVVNNVVAAGISSLGLEHTAILGNTIEQIAKEKGGIMKNGRTAYTVPQPASAFNVLQNIALTRNCTLNVVPNFDSYTWKAGVTPTLTSDVPVFKLNASLAIQLAHAWMSNHTNHTTNGNTIFTNIKEFTEMKTTENNCSKAKASVNFNNEDLIEQFVSIDKCIRIIPNETAEAISNCVWPGRCQTLCDESINYYIDGAHTLESMEVCVDWFMKYKRTSADKILIFNMTGDRNPECMLKILHKVGFNFAIFSPNFAFKSKECVDQINYSSCKADVLATCESNLNVWKSLNEASNHYAITVTCVEEALKYIKEKFRNKSEKPQVLITGSLHLVGAALAVLKS